MMQPKSQSSRGESPVPRSRRWVGVFWFSLAFVALGIGAFLFRHRQMSDAEMQQAIEQRFHSSSSNPLRSRRVRVQVNQGVINLNGFASDADSALAVSLAKDATGVKDDSLVNNIVILKAGVTQVNAKDGLNYVWIPPGTFRMGCSEDDNHCHVYERPAHLVTITKGFWLGQTPVTQAAYQKTMLANPSVFHGEQLPVETVKWSQAKNYCEAVGGRLPTEAEWEYAARAGSDKPLYGEVDTIAWYLQNSGNQTHEVGQKQPNQWQLYDMMGNVWEWVGDWYDEKYYAESPSQDPAGPASGQYRILRGGAWLYAADNLRASSRLWYEPEGRNYFIGIRCALEELFGLDLATNKNDGFKAAIEPSLGTTKVNRRDGLVYVWIAPGTFTMGCSPDDTACNEGEKPAHSVIITEGFWIGQTLVTQAAYHRVQGVNPSHFKGDQLPVDTVSWDDAVAYCSAVRMRLPREAEWEYAARSGTTTPRYGDIDSIAWYAYNSGNAHLDSNALGPMREKAYALTLNKNGNGPHPVKEKQPNAWKLYDMLGNLAEWTEDWYDDNYYGDSPSQDPHGPTSGTQKVLRGASWGFPPAGVRTSFRYPGNPGNRSSLQGFRCTGEALP